MVRVFGTGHRTAGADAVLQALDRGASDPGWWGQPREGMQQRPRRVREDYAISLWASWSTRERLGDQVLLTMLRRPFLGRQVCLGGMMIALKELNGQSGCTSQELKFHRARLWLRGGFNGPR